MQQYTTSHLVKGEDLNHHGTLFAARAAAWFVEAAFIAAGCTYGNNEIVCRNIHNMSFKKPVQKGTVLTFLARIVYTGKTSFRVAVVAEDAFTKTTAIEGMVTFVTVNEQTGMKTEHLMVLDDTVDETEIKQRQEARFSCDMQEEKG